MYWNGPALRDEARLRNFIIHQELARRIALAKGKKAESHRLGYEMSEDALSWNVFVSLAVAGRLRDAAEWLTGRAVQGDPQLYLWGRNVGLGGGDDARYPELQRVWNLLERDIRNYRTEPDIMLVVPGELLVCIEAKFGSGNPIAHESTTEAGEKPTSRSDLLARYLAAGVRAKDAVVASGVPDRLHSQLFRNIVFAAEMANGLPWHVVNLVSGTQWSSAGGRSAQRGSSARYSISDPTESVRSCLRSDLRSCFTFCTWEALHSELVKGDPNLRELDVYLRGKSAHFKRAFDLH